MAVTYDTITATENANTLSTLSHTHTGGAGANGGIVFIMLANDRTMVSCTWGGNACTYLGIAASPTDENVFAYYITGDLSGAKTVAATISGNAWWTLASITFQGVSSAAPITDHGGAGYGASPASESLDTLAGGMMVDAIVIESSILNETPGAGQTEIYDGTPVFTAQNVSYLAIATNPDTMSWTWDAGANNDAAHYAVCLGTGNYVAISGAITPSGVATKHMVLGRTSLAGAITPSGTVNRQTSKSFAGALTLVGAIGKLPKKVLAGVLSFVGALVYQPTQRLIAPYRKYTLQAPEHMEIESSKGVGIVPFKDYELIADERKKGG